ncbi:MAG: serine/threonine protein kinase [Verrucomicrobia bacterium]|nr:serine/threonine protein kinase [Verrucomicrobiota bacterium]
MANHGMTNSTTGDAAQARPFGPYYLHELINSGGMADIWLATTAQHEARALRIMHKRLRWDFLSRRRFISGCETLAKIHSNDAVIGYIEHGKIDGTLYLAMEYIEGSNLKQLFFRNDPLLEANLRQILADMGRALEQVHDAGFMHLDFKPENIIITRNAHVKLIDFDLSMPRPEKPAKQWKYPGTPAYMAPEQLLRKAIDHRADIFGFGVAAYELLTRRRPFAGDTGEEVLKKQLDKNFTVTPPRSYNPNLSAGLERVVLKCLERDLEKRYPWMSVLNRDLLAAA